MKSLTLSCSSMSHVIDRAVAFRFCGEPYHCVQVTPDSVTIQNKKGERIVLVADVRFSSGNVRVAA